MKSESSVSDRAYPSRDCLPGESKGEEVGSGRARGEQTGKSTASALASALTHCVPSNALFKMSLAHVSARQTIPWEKALRLGKRQISQPDVSTLLLLVFFSLPPSPPFKDAHSKLTSFSIQLYSCLGQ